MATATRSAVRISHGRGCWLVDTAGTRYLDVVQGRGTNSMGHASPVVSRALCAQAERLVHAGPFLLAQPTVELARTLVDSSGLDQVFFCNSGTESNEAAIKLARKWGRSNGRGHEIITLKNAFHGRTWAAMSATGREEYREAFGPLVPGFRQAVLNDIDSVAAQVTDATAAVMIELVQGEAGVLCAEQRFVQQLRALCDEHHLLLVVDEVQTGIGRLGQLFGFERFGVLPDIVTLGKGIAGGVPLAATLAREHACVFRPGDHGGTFNGSALATAVGLEVVRTVAAPAFLAQVRGTGEHLAEGLSHLSAKHDLAGSGGIGLMLRLDLGRPLGQEVVRYALAVLPREGPQGFGMVLNSPRPNLLRFLPPLTIKHREVEQLLGGLDRTLAAVLASS